MRLLAFILAAALCACATAEQPKKKKKGPRKVYITKVVKVKSKPRVIVKTIRSKPRVIIKEVNREPKVVVVRNTEVRQVIVKEADSATKVKANKAQIESLRDRIIGLENEIVAQALEASDKRGSDSLQQADEIKDAIGTQQEILSTPTPSPTPRPK